MGGRMRERARRGKRERVWCRRKGERTKLRLNAETVNLANMI